MITSIVVAAGVGKRMEANQNKAFLPLAGKPLLAWTLEAIASSKIDKVLVLVQAAEINRVVDLINEFSIGKVAAVLPGGEQRQDTVANALDFLPADSEIVAIHDGARPLIKAKMIDKAIDELADFDGIVPAVMPTDTIKKTQDGLVVETLDRQYLRAVQTPQIFKKKPLLDSYAKAAAENFYGTDDASVVERFGYKVKVIEGAYDNIKITTPTDLLVAEALIKDNK